MEIVRDNLHDMSEPISWEKKKEEGKNSINLSSTEFAEWSRLNIGFMKDMSLKVI